MSVFSVSKMAEEFSQEWHEPGDNLKENINQLLQVGDDCINLWLSPAKNNHKYNCLIFENRLLEYFEAVDENLLTMQKCIINVLRHLSYARQQLTERLAYKDKHSQCQSEILKLQEQNSLLKEEIKNKERKVQTMLEEPKKLNKSQCYFIKDQEDILYWYNEQEIQNLNREIGKINMENRYLKQKIATITEKYKLEIGNLQESLKKIEEKSKEVTLELNVKDAKVVNKFAENHIEMFEKNFFYFLNDYKRLQIENQQLGLKFSGSVLQENSYKRSLEDSDVEN